MPVTINGSTGISGVDGSAGTPAIQGSDSNTGVHFPAADTVAISTGGSERTRVDSSGRLLLGTSSARSNIDSDWGNYTPSVQFETSNDGRNGLSIIANASSGYPGHLVLGCSRGSSVGSNTAVQVSQQIGVVSFQGADGTNLIEAALIKAEIDATPGANDMPGRLVFSTTADGASSPTERMRIDNSGNVSINLAGTALAKLDVRSTTNTTGCFVYKSDTGTAAVASLRHDGATGATSRNMVEFGSGSGGTIVGTISSTGSATAYNTSSDYRLKENVIPLTGAVDRLNQLQVHRFNFIADPDTTVDGFLAHEAQAVVPECVTGEKDAVDDEGNPVYQGIDQSKLVPLLTAALQEALAKIKTLESEMTAVKAALDAATNTATEVTS